MFQVGALRWVPVFKKYVHCKNSLLRRQNKESIRLLFIDV
ncbi:hypothetical protein FH063_000966 [Azospirillum argentinense]|uniref:Uncharacterized protein n=1 Tax=Azospirillum argentinense TaxID=2970906 RepID=A0A5B0L413_9PROT|nr:hypothetical protein FH063_000966 [Azospirillum argentinense]